MAEAFLDGRPASLTAAVERAALLLGLAKLPVIAGLGTDTAGVRAAVLLAERLGGVLDHMHSDIVLRNIAVLRDTGWMTISPGEARHRADLFVFIGDGPLEGWSSMLDQLLPPGTGAHAIVIGAEKVDTALGTRGIGRDRITAARGEMPGLIGALRARVAGRPVAMAEKHRNILDAVVAQMKAARFGVAVWSAADTDGLAIEMICGLVKDLNATTRFSGLPVAAPDNGWGAAQTLGWMTGFPSRIGFGTGNATHDPWVHDADRLIASGEADAALWLSAYRPLTPLWQGKVATVALVAGGTRFREAPAVAIHVGVPGVDHDAVDLRNGTGALGAIAASAPNEAPPAHQVLGLILERLGRRP